MKHSCEIVSVPPAGTVIMSRNPVFVSPSHPFGDVIVGMNGTATHAVYGPPLIDTRYSMRDGADCELSGIPTPWMPKSICGITATSHGPGFVHVNEIAYGSSPSVR